MSNHHLSLRIADNIRPCEDFSGGGPMTRLEIKACYGVGDNFITNLISNQYKMPEGLKIFLRPIKATCQGKKFYYNMNQVDVIVRLWRMQLVYRNRFNEVMTVFGVK